MKKIVASLLGISALLLISVPMLAQDKMMAWTTKSEKAKELVQKASFHIMNLENAVAYEELQEALALDPDFTVALTLMSNVTFGKTSDAYAERAVKSAANKTEGEKIFASIAPRDTSGKTFKSAMAKLHEMFPDGKMLGLFYIFSLNTPEEQFVAAQDYLKKFPKEPAGYNTIAYLYMSAKKDTAAAKTSFEKYIELYPDGCNPYDSMGEYYFNKGDLDTSEKYYKMALEKYPFNNSSLNKLTEINKARDSKKSK